ncbi:SH3 domain-binding protein 5-like [Liparis tanakae]|uniref:SH3 domain-binding protein 5 n=1 Tax=Liparis tanakae TaxID=230148 RepID=A0A4Z2E9T2_9TELE|nr:SH3 domain-binding protein 5-like [Liparis tanakae]
MHSAAREMVSVAEQSLLADRSTMDPTWQEMLNHATAKVRERGDMKGKTCGVCTAQNHKVCTHTTSLTFDLTSDQEQQETEENPSG